MENKFYQVCNKMNYNTYQKIQNSFASIGFWSAISRIFTEQYPLLDNSLNIVYNASLLAYFGLILSNAKLHTKDISEIKTLYQQFIQNYNKMNKDFELNNPIQIYTMFNYLLYKGFLSKDHEFQFSEEEARDINAIMGTNIIMGKGVCRHISSMLKDILNDYGIEVFILTCYYRNNDIIVNISEPQKNDYIFESDYDIEVIIHDDEEWRMKSLLKKLMWNHAICYSRYNGADYYLDATQTKIYRLNPNSNTLFNNEDDSVIEIRQTPSIFDNTLKEWLKIKKLLLSPNPSISIEKEQELVLSTKKLCEQNMDIFEQFYNDNIEIYAEISNKLVKIKKMNMLQNNT